MNKSAKLFGSVSRVFAFGGMAVAFCLGAAQAEDKKVVALIEEITAAGLELEEMDFLHEGQVLELSPVDEITISYMDSCVVEYVAGGKVTIGLHHSEVANGEIRREVVDCDGEAVDLSGIEIDAGAGVFRSSGQEHKSDENVALIYDVNPFVKYSGFSTDLSITDLVSNKLIQKIETNAKGQFDFRDIEIELVPGRSYVLSDGHNQLEFMVSNKADAFSERRISRLISM